MKRTAKTFIAFLLTMVMLVSLVPASAFASTSYHAYMMVQTNTKLWIFRNAYDSKSYGKGTDEFKKGLTSVSKDAPHKYFDGKFTDVTMKKDGTYTVKLKGADFDSESYMSILGVSTDIPLSKYTSKKVKITNVKVKIDGNTKKTFATAVVDEKDANGVVGKKCINILCLNDWNDTVKGAFPVSFPVKNIEITFTVKGL